MKKYYFIIGLLTLFSSVLISQDPEFTQFYANPLYLNPAFAGTHGCHRVNLNYRNQWPSISGSFITSSFSYDREVENIGGLGALITQDVASKTISTTNISAIYAKGYNITKPFSIRVGFQTTFFHKTLDWNKLTFGDMIHTRKGFINPTQEIKRGGKKSGIDFSGGILGYSKTCYIGLAAHHVTEPDETLILGESPIPLKYTFHAGAILTTKDAHYGSNEVKISPNILYRKQGSFEQLNLGLYLIKGPIWAGFWYRNQDAFIVLFGLQSERFKVGYSYDVTTSKLELASGGSHEISLGMNFICKKSKVKFRPDICPSF